MTRPGKETLTDAYHDAGHRLRINDKRVRNIKSMKCNHEKFAAEVDVNRLEDTGRFMADVRIKCDQCGTPFRFLGLPAGLDMDGAAVSVDGEEARLAIGTNETVANIIDADCPVGFTVSRKGGQP